MKSFGEKNLRDRDHLKNPGVDGMITLKLIFKKWDGGLSKIKEVKNTDE
jgi:hypothetical protein